MLFPPCSFPPCSFSQGVVVSGAPCGRSDLVWWLRDDATPECWFCKREFALNRRRHHCRICGLIYCATCCTKTVGRRTGSSRVCGPCYARYARGEEGKEAKAANIASHNII